MRYATSTTVAGRSMNGRTMVMTVVKDASAQPRPSTAPAPGEEAAPPCTARCSYRERGACGFFPADRVKVGDPCLKW